MMRLVDVVADLAAGRLCSVDLVEQVLAATAGGEIFDNTYRFVVLVAVLPLLMVFLVWQVLRWKQQRKLLAAGIND